MLVFGKYLVGKSIVESVLVVVIKLNRDILCRTRVNETILKDAEKERRSDF